MVSINKKLHYRLNSIRRELRYWFPSPAEIKFIELMGGKVIIIKRIKFGHNRYPFAFVWWRGKFLRREYMKREVRCGPYFCDFWFETAYTRKAIEIDGYSFHKERKIDIVYDQRRDDYLSKRGVKVMRIDARDLWQKEFQTIQRVRRFLE